MEEKQEESIFSDIDITANLKYYAKHIRNARITLFVLGVVQLVGLFTVRGMVEPDKTITIASYLFLCLLFVALGLWTKHKPFMALLIAIIVYVGIYLTSAILEPTTFVSGLLIKIVVVALLVRGMRNAKAAEELKKTFNR